MNNNFKKSLYVFMPSNIELEKQIFAGLGTLELSFIVLFEVITLIICFALKIAINLADIYIGGTFLIVLGVSYSIVKKDTNGMSLLKMLKYFLKFLKSKKIYKYKFKTGWFKR